LSHFTDVKFTFNNQGRHSAVGDFIQVMYLVYQAGRLFGLS